MLLGEVQVCAYSGKMIEFVDTTPRMSDLVRAVGNEKSLLMLPTKVSVTRF